MRTRLPSLLVSATLMACGDSSDTHGVDGNLVDAAPVLALTNVPLTGCAFSYTGDFAIGDSHYRLLVDTGSPTLAVAGAGCDSCTAAGVEPLYTPSATASDLHKTGAQKYADGSTGWSGEIYSDLVTAGTLPAVPLAFVNITSQTDFFSPGTCGDPQGILGMSPARGLVPGTTSYPTEVAASGALDQFAMRYCVGTGDLWLDGYDPAAITADPRWVGMSGTYSYNVQLDDIAVDGASIGVPSSMYGPALVDSGGPALGVPASAYTAITTTVAASPAFQSRFGDASWFSKTGCLTLSESRQQLDDLLPKLTVHLGSPAISVELPATAGYLQAIPTPTGIKYCPAIFPSPGLTDLGNTVIRAGVVIFDRAHSRMGFASAPPCNDVTTQSVTRIPDMRRHRRPADRALAHR